MNKNQWRACCFIAVIICGIWLKWGSDRHTAKWNELNDSNKALINSYKVLNVSYKVEQAIVGHMGQVIAEKNLEIDQLNAQIKQLKEVK